MKATLKNILLFTLVISITYSCSVNNRFITKRKYSKGYTMSFSKKVNFSTENENDSSLPTIVPKQIKVASIEKTETKVPVPQPTFTTSCDDSKNQLVEAKTKKEKIKSIANLFNPMASVKKITALLNSERNNESNISSIKTFNSTGLTIGVVVALMVGMVLTLKFLEGTTAWLVALGIVALIVVIFAT